MRNLYIKSMLTALLLLCSTVATAHDFQVGGIYYNITDATAKTVEVTYIGSSPSSADNEYTGAVTIPSTVTYNGATYSVTSIGSSAFYNCTSLTNVTIPNSVTSIENYAFLGCTGLTNITIPNSVTSIGSYAFYGCTGLTSITIPNSVTSIGSYAFYNCTGLTSITIPGSVTSISNDAFYDCTGLKEVINFSNLTFTKGSTGYGYVARYADRVVNAPAGSIEGDFVFGVIDGVNTFVAYLGDGSVVTLPDYYKGEGYVIGSSAFSGCTGLTNITIPNSVTRIGDSAFRDCSGLTSVTIPNSVKSIGYSAFRDCSGLTSVTIPNSVKNIGTYAFEGCSGLTSITIPNSVTGIDWYAFSGCSGLTSITIPNSVTSIEYHTFYGCTNLTSVEIPNSVTRIGDGAFGGCTNLTSVEIPNSVTRIGYDAFRDCTSLTSITIPNSVTTIGNYAFSSCDNLTSVTIGNSVTTIGYSAFRDCTSLTSITIPNSVTTIGNYAFSSCDNLTSVTIGNSVTTIGEDAFYSCSNLKEIYCKAETPATIDYYTFYNCYSATLYVPRGAKDAYQSAEYWSNFANIVEMDFAITGDINGDDKVDVGDVTILIGMILDASLLTDSGDINGDNKVDVGDVTTLVAIILGANNTPARAAAMEEYNVELSVEGDEQSLSIDATATDYPYSAVQFDVYLPEGVTATGNMVVGCGNAAAYKEQADGAVRVVIYSPSNTAIANKSARIAIDATGLALGSHPVEVKNIILAAPGRAKAIAWDSTGYITIAGTTGIDGVVSDAGNADAVVYDLQGHRVTEIVKGRVYIKNGSKFIAQ